MKSILLSLKPEQVANVLNGKQTIIVRKKFPKDYVGWVYIYCTKHQPVVCNGKEKWMSPLFLTKEEMEINISKNLILSGKVVARFWCDKVEEITVYTNAIYETPTLNTSELLSKSCLHWNDLQKYLQSDYGSNVGYAVHISKLEVFDKPRELSEFNKPDTKNDCKDCIFNKEKGIGYCKTFHCNSLTKAPQNFCYIESEK